jgi:hypothetical protein
LYTAVSDTDVTAADLGTMEEREIENSREKRSK